MTETPAPRPRAPIATVFALLSFAVALILAGIYLWDRQNDRRDQINAMIDQLQRIDARLTKIETAVTAQGDAVTKLSAQTADITQSAATMAAQVAALHNDMDHLQQTTASADQAKQNAQIAELKTAVDSGHAFGAELAQIKTGDTAALQSLSSGITTPQQLSDELAALAPQLLTAAPKKSIWDRAMQNMKGWITPRPLPSANADTTTMAGKISRALYDLQQRDVQGALDTLPKDDARLTTFRTHAENYLAAQNALVKLESAPVQSASAPVVTSPTIPVDSAPAPSGSAKP